MISTDFNPLALEDYTIVSGLTQTESYNGIDTDIMITRDLIPQTKLEIEYTLLSEYTDGGDWQHIVGAYYDESAFWRINNYNRSDIKCQCLIHGRTCSSTPFYIK